MHGCTIWEINYLPFHYLWLKGIKRFYKCKKIFTSILFFSGNIGLQLESWTSYLQSFAKNIEKIAQVKKKLEPQAKHKQNVHIEAALQNLFTKISLYFIVVLLKIAKKQRYTCTSNQYFLWNLVKSKYILKNIVSESNIFVFNSS